MFIYGSKVGCKFFFACYSEFMITIHMDITYYITDLEDFRTCKGRWSICNPWELEVNIGELRKERLFEGSQSEMKFIWMYRQYTNPFSKTSLILSLATLKWTLWVGVYPSLLPIFFTSCAVYAWGLPPFSLPTQSYELNLDSNLRLQNQIPLPIDMSTCALKRSGRNCSALYAHCMHSCVRQIHKQDAKQ
jgi:hypothetical protein